MTIIIFLVDTSASMNQRTYLGTTYLDIAKGAVETFMKIRSRDMNSRWDRYMLLTFEDPPSNVKAGWKESHATFVTELGNLQATGLTSLGPALKNTFDLLNVNRMQSGIDTYGQGRSPFYLEPAVIICITDGRRFTNMAGVVNELNLPMDNTTVPGCELTKEPFRWDQRLFGFVLRMPGTPPTDNQLAYIPPADVAALDAMCDVTGGQSFIMTSQKVLVQCLENLVHKCQSGVVISFEKVGPDPLPVSNDDNPDGNKDNRLPMGYAWQNCRKLIYVPRSAQKGFAVGHWPIPEAFWPDLNCVSLPARTAHPIVKFSCTNCEAMVVDNLPFDKYELEGSSLTEFILERRQPNVAWQVFVNSSAKYSDLGHPFGYLKASSNLQTVNLFVMPYNYPVLVPLLDELIKLHKLKPVAQWRQQFESYLSTMPVYYATPLRRALSRMGIHNLVPEQLDNCIGYRVISYLKRLKNQAKLEYEKLVASVGQTPAPPGGIQLVDSASRTSILQRQDFHELMRRCGSNIASLKQEMCEYGGLVLAVRDQKCKSRAYTNPFDIRRSNLLAQIVRMRCQLLTPPSERSRDEDDLHNIPVQQMGNYQEYLKTVAPPLRALETQPLRQHTFGNPFKVNKNITIDEADEAMYGSASVRKRPSSDPLSAAAAADCGPGKKRKRGPLPRDVPIAQLLSPRRESPLPSPLVIDDDQSDNDSDAWTDASENGDLTNHVDLASLNGDASPHVAGRTTPTETAAGRQVTVAEQSQLRDKAIREVRRPGHRHDALLGLLAEVDGSLDTRRLFLRRIIHEALRFKRNHLAKILDEFEDTMIFNELRCATRTSELKPPSR